MNIVTMSGRLCKEPELRRTQNGTACCSFSLAVKRPKVKDTTDFHDCVVWQQGAEYLSQYGHKGDIVCVSGPLTTREWTDKDGNKRKTVEVNCDNVELLSSKRNSDGNSNAVQSQNRYQGGYSGAMQGHAKPAIDFQPIEEYDGQLPF